MTTHFRSRQTQLFANLRLADWAKQDLRGRMTQPSRLYHNLHHLELLWSRHLQFKDDAADRPAKILEPLIAFAIAYHDAIYVAGDPRNEELSAALWLEVSATATSLGVDDRHWVADTIRATADHVGHAKAIDAETDPHGYARQWVLDLDLSPLGERADVFDANMRLLEEESASATGEQRRADVISGLRYLSSARPLFRCPPIASAFAQAANRNFARHLSI